MKCVWKDGIAWMVSGFLTSMYSLIFYFSHINCNLNVMGWLLRIGILYCGYRSLQILSGKGDCETSIIIIIWGQNISLNN